MRPSLPIGKKSPPTISTNAKMFLLYVYQHEYNVSDDTIQSESISQLFLDKNFGFLATPMNDGSPHVTPV